jgi:hypothetical protein
MKLETERPVDQQTHPALALIARRRELFARWGSIGLRLQGFEVRGWRTSPIRRWRHGLRFPRIHIPRIPGIRTPQVACKK